MVTTAAAYAKTNLTARPDVEVMFTYDDVKTARAALREAFLNVYGMKAAPVVTRESRHGATKLEARGVSDGMGGFDLVAAWI